MRLLDVNLLVYAHREDSPTHLKYFEWLTKLINSGTNFAVSELVLSGFLRIVTHPKIFNPPSSFQEALAFIDSIRELPNLVIISPGHNHWSIFTRLCEQGDATGNLIPDAYHAALAIESGCQWVTADRGFSRFTELNWTTIDL